MAIPFAAYSFVLVLFLLWMPARRVEPMPWDTAKWHGGLHDRYAMRAALDDLLMEGLSVSTVQELLGDPIEEFVVGDDQQELELMWCVGFEGWTLDPRYMCARFCGDLGQEKLVSWDICR